MCSSGEPRRIWSPRILPAQHTCSAELVGLAFVASIQAEPNPKLSSQQLPRSQETANQQRPRTHKGANQQKPRHCSERPSIFTLSTLSSLSSSSSHFATTTCFLCRRPLPSNKDIYMYRGDQAFCTKQCRYHQMAIDENTEKMCLQPPNFTSTCRSDYYKHKDGSLACA